MSKIPELIKGSKLERLKLARTGYQTAKVNFNNQYAELSQYFYQIRSDQQVYTPQVVQGQFLNDGSVNDSVGMKNAKLMASSLMGMVWKDEKGTFRLNRPQNIKETNENKAYYKRISDDMAAYMERPKSRLTTSLFTSILGGVVYGTAGLSVQNGGYANPLKYSAKTVLSFYIGYDKDGEITELYIDYNMSADELWDKYGALAGGTVKAAIEANDHTQRFVMTEAIRPRARAERDNVAGQLGMPFAMDRFMPNDNILLETGGYESLPLKVLFTDKLEFESYGRSFAMDALPTVVQENIATEILAIGGELLAQPSLAMYDNGTLAGLAVDLSAGALNVFNVSGTVPTEKPIFPIFQVGDLREIREYRKELRIEIGEFFLLDKLFDLNQKQRMTLGEAMMRDQIRSDALSPIFTRILGFQEEVLTRSVDILFGLGLMGVPDPEKTKDPTVAALIANGITPFKIPDEILQAQLKGREWYDIQFISPAARIMNNEELSSTLKYVAAMGEASAMDADFSDVIDPDGTAEKLRVLLTTDSIVTRTPEARKERRAGRAEMQLKFAQIDAQVKIAQANQSNAQADASRAGAIDNIQQTPAV